MSGVLAVEAGFHPVQEQEASVRALSILAVLFFIGACALPLAETDGARGKPRQVGTIMDPYCAQDGSVVRLQYPNSQGSFEGTKANRENCLWNK